MRRTKFIIPLLLFAGACNAPSAVAPTTAAGGPPSTSIAADTTPPLEAPAAGATERGEGGILIGSGT